MAEDVARAFDVAHDARCGELRRAVNRAAHDPLGIERAREESAGVDGVEIHSANGYLLDSFLYDGSNKRTDAYGGPVDNRARFLLEVVEAVSALRGADRIGVRLSPSGEWNDMVDSDPEATFGKVAELLNPYGLAYLHLIEPRIRGVESKAGFEDAEPVAAAQGWPRPPLRI